jgi:hypothetical protein
MQEAEANDAGGAGVPRLLHDGQAATVDAPPTHPFAPTCGPLRQPANLPKRAAFLRPPLGEVRLGFQPDHEPMSNVAVVAALAGQLRGQFLGRTRLFLPLGLLQHQRLALLVVAGIARRHANGHRRPMPTSQQCLFGGFVRPIYGAGVGKVAAEASHRERLEDLHIRIEFARMRRPAVGVEPVPIAHPRTAVRIVLGAASGATHLRQDLPPAVAGGHREPQLFDDASMIARGPPTDGSNSLSRIRRHYQVQVAGPSYARQLSVIIPRARRCRSLESLYCCWFFLRFDNCPIGGLS